MKKRDASCQSSKILPLQDKCAQIHAKIVFLQKAMKRIEKKSSSNIAWRGLLNAAVKGMNEALEDLEKRLDHIGTELKELMVFAFVLFLPAFFFLGGCASVQETGKKIWGTSIEHLEKKRSEGQAQVFALGQESCFLKTEGILKDLGADIYLKDEKKTYIVAMNFKHYVNTTQAGIFFTSLSPGTTKIEVSSLSPQLVVEVAERIFSELKEFNTVQEPKGDE